MTDYYAEKLAAARLRRCYEIAPPAVRAYLRGEIDFVLSKVAASDSLLELGCGYGRVLAELAGHVRTLWGIDTSLASLVMARGYLSAHPCDLAAMDATRLAFPPGSFDHVICIQNGISAFHVDRLTLLKQATRVTRPGGTVLLSSYFKRFWRERLAWFEAQSAEGLIGPIDYQATGDGEIVCTDGFRATTVSPDEFLELAATLGIVPVITEVAHSSLFCELVVP
jgi:ubiquinone/menaquinone biosynthesis C-methylase UbiE